MDRFEPGSNCFAWLCAIARHRLLAECKRLQRQNHNRQNFLNQLLIELLHTRAAAQAELNGLRLRFLSDGLAQLAPEARHVLDERYQRHTPVEAIAHALGRTASAVSVQLFALRKKLRACIERKANAFPATER